MLFEVWISCGVLSLLGCLLLLVAYSKLSAGACYCKTDMSDKVVLVTGASSGIGLETARQLAALGARVIMACRDFQRGKEALQEIVSSTGNPNVVLKKLDLSSLSSVRAFAEDLLASHDRLDVLVNNAGVMTRPARTAEGLDSLMVTNFFGPFLLTRLLFPLLRKSAPSRIVVVGESNLLVRNTSVRFERLNDGAIYRSGLFRRYALSKLAVLVWAQEMAAVLEGTGVTVNSLHPGYVRTRLTRAVPRLVKPWLGLLRLLFFKSPVRGAQTSVHLAVAEGLKDVTGKHFSDCREGGLSNKVMDRDMARKLWLASELITGLSLV